MLTTPRSTLCMLCLGLGILAGCGQHNPNRGNFLGVRAASLVGPVAAKIVTLYPPAKTRFIVPVEPRGDDLFGVGLVGMLRQAGYAVYEYPGRDDDPQGKGLLLTYVVDEFEGQVRVLVHIEHDSLCRLYDIEEHSGELVPAGGWIWRRGGLAND